MKNLKFLGITFFILLLGCEKDKGEPFVSTEGDVYVTVKYNDGTFAENAIVYTKPDSVQGVTDNFGTVLLKGLEKGNTEIIANVGNIGAGKTIAEVIPNDLVEVNIEIIKGISDGKSPQISITSPAAELDFSYGDAIEFSAIVSDEATPSEDIIIIWKSDIDGILNTESPNESGVVSFTSATLSKGQHTITLTAEDLDGFKSIATLNISTLNPQKVELGQLSKENGNVKISWTKYKGDDFAKYEVYRSTQGCYEEYLELIGEINDISDTIFYDATPPLEYQACYAIKVTNNSSLSCLSNFSTIDYPGGVVFNFVPDDMLKHPTEKYVYLISKSNQKVVKYDYTNNTIIKETSLQGTVGFCDINNNGFGVELYVPSRDGNVYVYNADDLSLSKMISTELPATCAVADGHGNIIVSVVPSPWWEQPVRTYQRSNGMNIDGAGDQDLERLRKIPGKDEYISINQGSSPTDMQHYKFDDQAKFLEENDDSYHGDYALDAEIYRISEDGSYVITAYNGSVYLANSGMSYQGNLENGNLKYSDFAFSSDGKVIYAATSNRKSIQIGKYPSLIRDNEIALSGYPHFIQRDGDKLIAAVTSEQENSIKSGIEIVDIP
ncbi:hypothetical protein [Marinifilum flexuosum]|uniref:hypothetical protein n=1 Tax=Marinifilum flexuosum TaxID=1117708 RepID=UPI0024923B85|nr:hypothetical protein [Marinifilum flexuosum]